MTSPRRKLTINEESKLQFHHPKDGRVSVDNMISDTNQIDTLNDEIIRNDYNLLDIEEDQNENTYDNSSLKFGKH